MGMKIPPEPPSQLIVGRALGLYPEPVFVIVKPVTAETVAVNEPAEPPSQLIIGRALGLYPDPVFVIVKPVTIPSALATHVPEKPVPSQFATLSQEAVSDPPFVYPLPPAETATDAIEVMLMQ